MWGDRIFLLNAVKDGDAELKVGLYGSVTSVPDEGEHQLQLVCIHAQGRRKHQIRRQRGNLVTFRVDKDLVVFHKRVQSHVLQGVTLTLGSVPNGLGIWIARAKQRFKRAD